MFNSKSKARVVTGVIHIVNDLKIASDFYQKLGFRPLAETKNIAVVVELSGFWLELLLSDEVVTKAFKQDIDARNRGAGQYLHIQVDDVDKYCEQLQAVGINIMDAPADYPWNRREATVQDPDGYKLVFYTNL